MQESDRQPTKLRDRPTCKTHNGAFTMTILNDAIRQAAEDFIDMEYTILSTEEMEKIIENWLEDHLTDITHFSHQIQGRKDFEKAELKAELEMLEDAA